MSGRPTAVLFCPGRGSYGLQELGSIGRQLRPGPVADALKQADIERRLAGQPPLSQLDAAEQFRPGLHLEGRSAAGLIYFATVAQLHRIVDEYEVVAIAGNSLGWYTALAAAGCVDVETGWRLVATMAELQRQTAGAQCLTTTLDERWRTDPDLARAVAESLEATNARGSELFVAHSIRLGGHEVLAGTEAGVEHLLASLPKVATGERSFPFRLAGHGPFHTRLCADVAAVASDRLADLPIGAPRAHLIDGRGDAHTPWSADPAELRRYTLETQVTTTFDFSAAVRTAIREFNPDVLLCAGPGTSLRAPVGHVVVREGWRGIHDKDALFASDLVRVA